MNDDERIREGVIDWEVWCVRCRERIPDKDVKNTAHIVCFMGYPGREGAYSGTKSFTTNANCHGETFQLAHQDYGLSRMRYKEVEM